PGAVVSAAGGRAPVRHGRVSGHGARPSAARGVSRHTGCRGGARDHRAAAGVPARAPCEPAQPARVRPRPDRHRRRVRADPDAPPGPPRLRGPGPAIRRSGRGRMSASPMMTGTTTAKPKLDIPREVGLTASEAERVRALVGREPNALEWAMFGAMWSEHCAYKHSKPLLRTLPTKGPRVAVGPGENAGAVDLGDGLLCAFKVESHNHPSAVEPYQGAATGVGGILRDVFAMGARPVALLNALCFGTPDEPRARRLVGGVVGGIGFYGNCVGIPDVAGHVSFEPCYLDNPLVNAMCVGLVERDRLRFASSARPGSAVYLVGSDTGRDGIAGASLLASFELGEGSDAHRPSVQVGNPFLEKLLMEATLELIAMDAVEAVQDLGAAGLTCATSEVAARSGVGMRVDVDAVPRRADRMTPYEVMLSESQE